MEKKHILMALAMTSLVAINTGCKNESKRLVEVPKTEVGAESINPNADVAELTALEKARIAKADLQAALTDLGDAKQEEREVRAKRQGVQAALETATGVYDIEELSADLAKLNAKIAALETEVKLSGNIVDSKRALLNKEIEDLTEAEKAQIGEGDIEYQVAHNELKVRLEMSYEALKTAIGNEERTLGWINIELTAKSMEMDALLNSGQGGSDKVKALGVEISKLKDRREASLQQLSLSTASQENMAEVLRTL